MAYPVPARWDVSKSHQAKARIEVWSKGSLVEPDAPIIDGDVKDKWVTGLRRSLSLLVPPSWSKWLDLPGLEIRPYSGLSWGVSEFLCPLGRFPLLRPGVSLPSAAISISTDDYWQQITVDDFVWTVPSYSQMPVKLAAGTLMAESGIYVHPDNITASSVAVVPEMLWDKSRADTIATLLESIGAEAFVDRNGDGIVRDRAVGPFGPPLMDGDNGTLISVVNQPNCANVFNVVSAASSNQNANFDAAIVTVDDPGSPAHYSRIGRRSKRYTSPLLMDKSQAQLAAQTILDKSILPALNWQVTCVPDVSRDAGDQVVASCGFGSVSAVIQEITHPLSGKPQTMTLGAL